MYHNQKKITHQSEQSEQEKRLHSVPIEEVPYSEEEMAFLLQLARRQEEEWSLPEE